MVGMRNETIISMRFVRSKLRKREESSHNTHRNSESNQQAQIISTVEPVGFRQSPSSVWHFPPLPPQPNLSLYNDSQVSTPKKNCHFLSNYRIRLWLQRFCCFSLASFIFENFLLLCKIQGRSSINFDNFFFLQNFAFIPADFTVKNCTFPFIFLFCARVHQLVTQSE